MKRVQSACLYQTLHFAAKEPLPYEETVDAMKAEVEHYKRLLQKTRRKFEILKEEVQPDGSIVIEVKKAVSGYKTGNYI